MGKKKPTPLRISEKINGDVRWEIEGSLEGAIAALEFYRDSYKNKYESMELMISEYNSYGDRWPIVEIYGYRLETEAEMSKRLAEEQARLDKQEKFDREQYEKLRKKYADNSDK